MQQAQKRSQQNRQKCSMAGVALMNEAIINKGSNRDIHREAINMLITRLNSGRYDTVVVKNMSDITADKKGAGKDGLCKIRADSMVCHRTI